MQSLHLDNIKMISVFCAPLCYCGEFLFPPLYAEIQVHMSQTRHKCEY